MVVVVCIDEQNGMMFNKRRQSRDSKVCADVLSECSGKQLYMTPYSFKLFEKMDCSEVNVIVTDNFMKQAGTESICFVEKPENIVDDTKIQKIIIYQWNRHYPADKYFPLRLSEEEWKLEEEKEFEGTSHKRITKMRYVRRTESEKK